MEANGQYHDPATLAEGNLPLYPLRMRIDKTHSRSRLLEKRKILYTCWNSNQQILGCPVRRLFSTLITLSRFYAMQRRRNVFIYLKLRDIQYFFVIYFTETIGYLFMKIFPNVTDRCL